jgi:hypothetical protein
MLSLFGSKKYKLVLDTGNVGTKPVPPTFEPYYNRYLEVKSRLTPKTRKNNEFLKTLECYFVNSKDPSMPADVKVNGNVATGAFTVSRGNKKLTIYTYPLTGTVGGTVTEYGNTYTLFTATLDEPLVDYIWGFLYTDMTYEEKNYIEDYHGAGMPVDTRVKKVEVNVQNGVTDVNNRGTYSPSNLNNRAVTRPPTNTHTNVLPGQVSQGGRRTRKSKSKKSKNKSKRTRKH